MKTRVLAGRLVGRNGPYIVNFVYITLQFKLQDIWVGVYWRNESEFDRIDYVIWICLVPMLPICIRRVRHL
jgi:hypothetical protein